MNDDTALMDIESIKQLKARYCRYLDTKDWDRWRDLFTDDFVGDTTQAGGTVIVGVDEFMAYTRNRIGKPSQATVHQVHAPEIELTSANDCEPPRRRSRVALPTKTPNCRPPGRLATPVCFIFDQLRRNHVSPRAMSWVPPRFIGLLRDAATVRGK
jgi:SnoaL-like domain